MLKPQVHQSESARPFLPKLLISCPRQASLLSWPRPARRRNPKRGRVRSISTEVRDSITSTTEKSITVKALITVKLGGLFSNIGLTRGLDEVTDLMGKTLLLELVSNELDPKTGLEKETMKGYARKVGEENEEVKYESKFIVPVNFGDVGAVLVENEHHNEMFVKTIILNGFPNGPVNIACNSWVHSKFDNPENRLFFTNKSYLPFMTPNGLKRRRERELEKIRGNGEGERKSFERIYDYDTYNDLGEPDKSDELARPVLGGLDHPYPRRCRTGRDRSNRDPLSEKRSNTIYVPRDEALTEVKKLTLSTNTLNSVFHALLPELDKDNFSWFRDEEFSRQTLAGLNPYSIQLVMEWPLKSKLDPKIYGPPESAITKELIEREIKGIMTLDEALEQKKLFILDYHDLLLPYVNKVRELEGTTLYGSRTLFFLTHESVLRPIAIELTRPPTEDKLQWKEVFTPSWDSTNCWLWRFARAHVRAHDSGYHQLVHHWLRTHCCMEPYIIASNRQLSTMHPIFRLLFPHFRYTLEINAIARQNLIKADGIIESTFSPGKYSMELSSVVYDQLWRFDMEALPADLIRRGMAIEDPTAEHGLKLTIEDYPFANDGLILWDAIKKWVSDYVNHFYPEPSFIESDQELQAWWTEIRTEGHKDKKDEPWWPLLKTPDDLIQILTIIIWVASGQHAAVNFGQSIYADYNRPTIARTNMPTEEPSKEEYKNFLDNPEFSFIQCFPSQLQSTKLIAILDVLSNHSPDEEYLGVKMEPSWSENPIIMAAFEEFNRKLRELEVIINARNLDLKLKNRSGAGVFPYELLKPFSKPGVTGMGVPNSISI